MASKGRSLYRNGVSYFGALTAAGSALVILFLLLVDAFSEKGNPYLGIVTYLVMPGGVLGGVAIFLFGMRHESVRRRRAKSADALPFPKLDLNDPRQRVKFALFLIGGGLGGVLLLFAGYKGFHYTESISFCGQVCHTVMQPEFELYQRSAHARVPCVACHVGEGVDWYVKAKLSGVRQVIAVIRDSYERPIPTPIEGLRPARETCERCHWPEKFFGSQFLQIPHYRYTEKNNNEQISLHMKVGGGQPQTGQSGGVHWHMVISNEVKYVAVDRGLQHIAKVSVKHKDGTTEEFESLDVKLPPEGGQRERTMDCMDCHNRPSHRVDAPEEAVNRALSSGLISAGLPHIKTAAVDALIANYPDDGAPQGIRDSITKFYQFRYPALLEGATMKDVNQAIDTVTAIHKRNVFPKMKVGFGTYPSHIGHRNWPGCFRCHDNRHVSKTTGKVITNDCGICHSKPQRSALTPLGTPPTDPNPDWHPFPLRGEHAKILCHKCHAAGTNPSRTCTGCHDVKSEGKMMEKLSCGECHLNTDSAGHPTCSTATCHITVGGLHKDKGHAVDCVRCHTPHKWKSTATVCRTCHGEKPLPANGVWK